MALISKAVAIVSVRGGIQASRRAYCGRLSSPDRPGEFYGFYNMMGKFAAVLGPLLMGTTALVTGSSRIAILSIVILFAAGAALLRFSARGAAVSEPVPAHAGGR